MKSMFCAKLSVVQFVDYKQFRIEGGSKK